MSATGTRPPTYCNSESLCDKLCRSDNYVTPEPKQAHITRLDAEIAVGSDYAIDEHTPTLLEYLAEHGAQPAKALAALVGVPVEVMTPWLEWAREAGLIQPAGDRWAVTTKGRKAAIGR